MNSLNRTHAVLAVTAAVLLNLAFTVPALAQGPQKGGVQESQQSKRERKQDSQPQQQQEQQPARPQRGARQQRQPAPAVPAAVPQVQRQAPLPARTFDNRRPGRPYYSRNDGRRDSLRSEIRQRQFRPPQHGGVRPTLPPTRRAYNWNGRPYYWYGGSWYRPYGGRYLMIGPPVGLFVSSLPYYSTVWVGGSRYYYADNTYYAYEPLRRGYVVTRSPYADDPYGDDEEDSADAADDEGLYVYPTRGQSEQQQADDRYECHRWAVDQTQFDPTDSDYDADQRAEYDRALTACLTGRGYSVR